MIKIPLQTHRLSEPPFFLGSVFGALDRFAILNTRLALIAALIYNNNIIDIMMLLLLCSLICATAAAANTEIRFIAQDLIETGRTFDGTAVGGLSGLDYLPWYVYCIIVVDSLFFGAIK
jgi:hypothetical protein